MTSEVSSDNRGRPKLLSCPIFAFPCVGRRTHLSRNAQRDARYTRKYCEDLSGGCPSIGSDVRLCRFHERLSRIERPRREAIGLNRGVPFQNIDALGRRMHMARVHGARCKFYEGHRELIRE